MTASTLFRTSDLRTRPGSGRGVRRAHRSRSGREPITLEGRLSRAWEGLLTTGAAPCPVCHGVMTRAEQAGVCGGCGTSLS